MNNYLILFTAVFLFTIGPGKAQEFISLGNDTEGDFMSGIPVWDIAEILYRSDSGQDSAWFWVKLFDQPYNFEADYAVYIPIDTDENPATGSSLVNLTTQYDNILSERVLYFAQLSPNEPIKAYVGAWNGLSWNFGDWLGFDSLAPISHEIVDDSTVILGVQLSLIDEDTDGEVSLAVLTGWENGFPADVFPNNGYTTTPIQTATHFGEVQTGTRPSLKFFPNPILQDAKLKIQLGDIATQDLKDSQCVVYSLDGRPIKAFGNLRKRQELDLSGIQAGIYLIVFEQIGNNATLQGKLTIAQ